MTRRNAPLGERAADNVTNGVRAGYWAMQQLMMHYRPSSSIYLLAEAMRRRMRVIADLHVGRRDVLLDPGHSTKGVKSAMQQGKNGASKL